MDVHEYVHLWGCHKEIARFNELLKDDTMTEKSRAELAEIAFSEDWPSKLLKEHQCSFTSTSMYLLLVGSIGKSFELVGGRQKTEPEP
jgi:hypothetical protein